ncbi:MAG: SDR family NAD(P)-dependent oxidoreductase [Sphingopyxis sp.]|nr:SDR family NAD(P)-dependent oxidoreductase [Sphingopyxis sp.]
MQINLAGKVAIVTGAGNGLGRTYAFALAQRGAKVVVNDLASEGAAAQGVVEAIAAAGGEAIVCDCSVTDETGVADMVARTRDRWGRVDILINNAGMLQNRRFGRVSLEEIRRIVEVNLMGSVICSHAVWEAMSEQGYGRILMTTSEGGLYPVPGAASYAAAKLGVVGLMNALSAEGDRYGIRVNSIAPAAATRMTDGLLSERDFARMGPASVVAAALFLVGEQAPRGAILAVGAGRFERAYITHTLGAEIPDGKVTPEAVAERFMEISCRMGDQAPDGMHSVARVGQA